MTNKTTSAIDLVERVARALCEARGESPGGCQVRFIDGEAHSATFLDIARHDARAAIEATGLADTIARLQAALTEQRQVVDTGIIHKLETQSHGGLTEFGEGGLAALRAVEREFQRIEAVGGE